MKKYFIFALAGFLFLLAAQDFGHAAAAAAAKQKKQQGMRAGPGGPAGGGQQPPALSTEQMDMVINRFQTSSEVWTKIPDQAKIQAVSHFIEEYSSKGTIIAKPPAYYASMINGMTRQNAAMLSKPLANILQIIAIVEYDFGNGQDPDMMARKVLGEAGYLNNKKRLEAKKPA